MKVTVCVASLQIVIGLVFGILLKIAAIKDIIVAAKFDAQ
jgi:hypothetical protein